MTKLDRETLKRDQGSEGYTKRNTEAYRVLCLRGVCASLALTTGAHFEVQVDDPPRPPRKNFTAWLLGTGVLMSFDMDTVKTAYVLERRVRAKPGRPKGARQCAKD